MSRETAIRKGSVREDRAPMGGEVFEGRHYRGGEFVPFYVPRDEMPQINGEDIPAFMEFCRDSGVKVLECVLPVPIIRAHQRIDHKRVRTMPLSIMVSPVLTSADNYVLDGNHRQAARRLHRVKYGKAIALGLEWNAALDFMFTFPKTWRSRAIDV